MNKRTPPARVLHALAELPGRNVGGLMSDNHIDSDIAVEVFMLLPVGTDPVVRAAIAGADRAPG